MFSLCLHREIGVKKVLFHLIYVECKHHSDKYNQAGANDIQHLIWIFWVMLVIPNPNPMLTVLN